MAEGVEYILTKGRNSDDDRNNALKHCSWACCLAQVLNRQTAMDVTDVYEGDQKWAHPCSSQMDRHNNVLGATLGSANPNRNGFDLCNTAGSLQCEKRQVKFEVQCTYGE